MVKIHDLDSYSINDGDKFFFDTNIWMYIYCSIGDYKSELVESYSGFYEKIATSGNPIYSSSLLVSEFINSYSRLEFNIIKKRDGLRDFKKDFRNSPKYGEIFENINLLTEAKIIGNTVPLNDGFDGFKAAEFFDIKSTYDFNDEYYSFLASKNDFKIVTNDKDFLNTKYDIDIITLRG